MKKSYKRSGSGINDNLIAEGKIPDWIKKAQENWKRRVKYRMKKQSISFEEAERQLTIESEEAAQDGE